MVFKKTKNSTTTRLPVQNVHPDAHQWPSSLPATTTPPSLDPSKPVSKLKDTAAPVRKRLRQTYTKQQLDELEREFQIDQFLYRIRRTRIAERLAITEKQVKVWFQNRRMKYKKNALKADNISGTCHLPTFAPQKSASIARLNSASITRLNNAPITLLNNPSIAPLNSASITPPCNASIAPLNSASITPLNSAPITSGFNTPPLVEKAPSLQPATDRPPQQKLITFADTQRAVQEFLAYAEELRKQLASNQSSSSMDPMVAALKLEKPSITYDNKSTIKPQPVSPPCSPPEFSNNSCDDIDFGFLDYYQEPELTAWNDSYSPISQTSSLDSPPFDMTLDYLNSLLNF